MKGDKAATAAKSSPEWRSCRETNEGRQGGSSSQEQPRMEIMQGDKWRKTRRQQQPRAAQNGDHAGRQMKGDKAAAAAKSSPEWRSCREINEGRQGGSSSQEQPRMEIMQGDKWRKTRRQGQPRAAQNGDQEGRQMKETTIWRLWGSATQSLRTKNPYSFQLSGEKTNVKPIKPRKTTSDNKIQAPWALSNQKCCLSSLRVCRMEESKSTWLACNNKKQLVLFSG